MKNYLFESLLICLGFMLIGVSSEHDCGYGSYYDGEICRDCGTSYVKPNIKIVGGVPAVEGSWPSQVLVVKYWVNDGQKYYYGHCGGSLINRHTVLTAAHCIGYYGSSYIFVVYAGIYNISDVLNNQDISESSVFIGLVGKTITHENYDYSNNLNDIALHILYDPIPISDHIDVVCLPGQSNSFPAYNRTAYLAGWGTLESGGNIPDVLYNVNITVYNPSLCDSVLPWYVKDWESQICAGEFEGGKDSCQGDSGGPVFVEETVDTKQKYFVSGIVSYGYGCGFKEYPGIYTRTSYFVNWIKKNWMFGPPPPPPETTTQTSTVMTTTETSIIFTDYPSSTPSLRSSVYKIIGSIILGLFAFYF